ncbi:MAG: UDP-N-acetylmuramoyl-L-alanine--D-glutamate ligase [Saprospiraceae bacterium]
MAGDTGIGIIGAAESGIGAALLAKKKGFKVFVSDFGQIKKEYKDELKYNNIPFEEGGHTIERLIEFGLVIKSPGVPDSAAVLRRLKKMGTKVISEIEFGCLNYSGTLVAITGSNGKTTTSGLIYHLLKTAKFDVEIGGNYGVSFARILSEKSPAYMVLELSSFQLDNIETFRPFVSVVLNITPDHLDRYDYNINNYAKSKMRIIENQTAKDHFVYNEDDPIVTGFKERDGWKQVLHPISEYMFLTGITSKEGAEKFEISIKGKHNLFNARCAVEVCRILNIGEPLIRKGLSSFINEPHRFEIVATYKGITFINDSKATNVDSVYYALDAIDGNIVWIAGGTDKGNNYSQVINLAAKKVKSLICLGIDNTKLVKSFAEVVPCIIESTNIVSVVENAIDIAEFGDVVILSPACASFDLFENYIDRGNQYKECINNRIKELKIKELKN